MEVARVRRSRAVAGTRKVGVGECLAAWGRLARVRSEWGSTWLRGGDGAGAMEVARVGRCERRAVWAGGNEGAGASARKNEGQGRGQGRLGPGKRARGTKRSWEMCRPTRGAAFERNECGEAAYLAGWRSQRLY